MKMTEPNLKSCPGREGSDPAMELPAVLGTGEFQLDITRISVDLAGEIDAYDLETLCQVLDALSHSRGPASVNLSGVTFLDLGCARELAIRSHLCGGRLTLRSPSWQAAASLKECGYEHGPYLPPPTATPPMRISEVG